MEYYEKKADTLGHLYLDTTDYLTPTAHFHDAVELVLVLRGSATVCINGQLFTLGRGDATLCHSLDVHYYKTAANALYFVMVADRSYLGEFYETVGKGSFARFFSLPAEALAFAAQLGTQGSQENRLLRLSSIYYLLSFVPLLETDEGKREAALAAEVLRYIQENADKPLTAATLAEQFGYSRGYFSTLFCAMTGESFRSYLNRVRVRKVKKALAEAPERGVLTVALENGFDSAATFYRAYRREFGSAPLEKLTK